MYSLTVCTMIQGENSYLPEWIAHHAGIGVEHFFIYDNESPTPLARTLEPEVRSGLATVVPIQGRFMQLAAFNDGLRRFGPDCRWMAFLDLDEFLNPKRHDDLPALLESYQDCGGLAVHWQMFGSSGHEVRPPGLEIENFLTKADVRYVHNRHLKCIVRPEAVESLASPHHAVFRPGYECVNENRFRVLGGQGEVSVDVVQLNHYYTRSRKEYGEKIARGRVDYDGPMSFTFDEINPALNRVRDESILRFVPRVKEYLDLRARVEPPLGEGQARDGGTDDRRTMPLQSGGRS